MPADAPASHLHHAVEMKGRLLSALARERVAGLRNLSGTQLDVTVPVTQRLVNLLLERTAAGRQLGNARVTLRGGNAITVTVVKPVLGFAARLALDLRVQGGADLASDPRVYLVVDRPSVAWSAISRIAVATGLAPAGVEIGRDGVAVDLRTLGARAGVGDLVSAARAIAFEGEPGVLRVRIALQVAEGGLAASQPADQGPSTDRPPGTWLDPAELLPELRGTRLQGRVVATEGLVNEALDAVLDAARDREQTDATERADTPERTPPLDGQVVARWIQRAGVRFEDGRIVLEADVEVT